MRAVPDVLSQVDAAVSEGCDSDALLRTTLDALEDEDDTLTALAAVHALARVPGVRSEIRLLGLILDGPPGFAEHALWALATRGPSAVITGPVANTVSHGGVAGMHAQRVLRSWAKREPGAVLAALESTLRQTADADARRYVVETIGLVPGRPAAGALERVAVDDEEAVSVRATAIAALGDRVDTPLPASVVHLGSSDDEIGRSVRAAERLRRSLLRGPRRREGRDAGVRVAQVHLGETGGVATLLPQLGEILSRQEQVAETITIVRKSARMADISSWSVGHRLDGIPLVPGEGGSFTSRWPSLVAAERGIRASFLSGRLPDVVHLRMADPGTLAGARVATSLGIPLVFTLAPDPHGPIDAAETAGALDRRTFAAQDRRAAWWLRVSLVERLAREARELVLFPRAGLRERLRSLTGIDLRTVEPRYTVVSEGVDTARSDLAATALREGRETPPVLADLELAIGALPDTRRGRPIVVTAGRMDPIKGMARLVEAFGRDGELADRANLVVIGGDLATPSAAEAAELARIQAHLERHPWLRERVILLGQRSHHDVALVMAAARAGWGTVVGPGGSYACASAKEEFGLAIIEALAAGLPVTAPIQGGPATYVAEGTGVLVDTTDTSALGPAIRATLELSRDAQTAVRARAVVDARYTLARMAQTLGTVYHRTCADRDLAARARDEREATG
jgi:glycosyltransferase involved in cell wall biosynthesis